MTIDHHILGYLAKEESFNDKEFIVKEGSGGHWVYVIIEGEAKVKKNTPKARLSLMFQYQPYFKANLFPEINRPINRSEYTQIKPFVEELGLEGWVQDFRPQENLAGPYFKPDK